MDKFTVMRNITNCFKSRAFWKDRLNASLIILIIMPFNAQYVNASTTVTTIDVVSWTLDTTESPNVTDVFDNTTDSTLSVTNTTDFSDTTYFMDVTDTTEAPLSTLNDTTEDPVVWTTDSNVTESNETDTTMSIATGTSANVTDEITNSTQSHSPVTEETSTYQSFTDYTHSDVTDTTYEISTANDTYNNETTTESVDDPDKEEGGQSGLPVGVICLLVLIAAAVLAVGGYFGVKEVRKRKALRDQSEYSRMLDNITYNRASDTPVTFETFLTRET